MSHFNVIIGVFDLSKNPVLQKKFDEGYEKGFMDGSKLKENLITDSLNEFIDQLMFVPGIGLKTIEKIKKHLKEVD